MKWIVRNDGEPTEIEVERVLGGFEVLMGGERRRVEVIRLDESIASLRWVDDGRSFSVSYRRGPGRHWRIGVCSRTFELETLTPVEAIEVGTVTEAVGPSRLEAPIPGKVVKIHVKVGDEVEAGQPLVVLEAMKMENELTAEQAGKVIAVHVEPGQVIDAGGLLVELE